MRKRGGGGGNFLGHDIFFSTLRCAMLFFLVGNSLGKNFFKSNTGPG